MKMKFIEELDEKRIKGYEVEVDKIKYDPVVTGLYAVRVISEWKKPTWLAIAWFIHPNAEEN